MFFDFCVIFWLVVGERGGEEYCVFVVRVEMYKIIILCWDYDFVEYFFVFLYLV